MKENNFASMHSNTDEKSAKAKPKTNTLNYWGYVGNSIAPEDINNDINDTLHPLWIHKDELRPPEISLVYAIAVLAKKQAELEIRIRELESSPTRGM